MDTLKWLSQLVAFDTTSRNSNLALIEYVKAWLDKSDIETHLTYDASEPKANLFATIPAADGSRDGGLILSGHTDVVPVDGQDWQTDPFIATQNAGRIYGRGTCDMKGFIAVVLGLVPTFQKMQLPFPIHIALSYDEEIGCRGAPLLIKDMLKRGIKPKACIVGEPTNMQAIIAHKGINVFRCRVQGIAAHSSLTPQGCNAIEYAAQFICHIRSIADELRKDVQDEAFDVPFTTVSTNMIQGGNAHNTIPANCEFVFEFRNLPSVKPSIIIEKIADYFNNVLVVAMRQEHPQARIEIDHLAGVPSFESKLDAQSILNRLVAGEVHKVAYATEAGLFQASHIPTIVCGPGSIEQAHRANEYVTLEQLQLCEKVLRSIVSPC